MVNHCKATNLNPQGRFKKFENLDGIIKFINVSILALFALNFLDNSREEV